MKITISSFLFLQLWRSIDSQILRAHIGKQPSFTYPLKDTSAVEGEAVELACETDGDPRPTINWLINGKAVVPTSRYELSKANSHLRIYPFQENDVGNYICEAKNIHGKIEQPFRVSLAQLEKPMISDAPVSQKANLGEQVTMRCVVKGIPKPEIGWYFEGVRMPRRNTKYQISDDDMEVVIEKVTRHDAGIYACRAKNSVGFASAEATLSVDTALTDKIDALITNDTIAEISRQATDNVNRALTSTKEANKKDKIDDPENLRQLFRFAANLKTVDLGKAREIYEESIRLIQLHIEKGLNLTHNNLAPNVSYEAVLPVPYIQTLMEKSGCQTGLVILDDCNDMCFHNKYRTYDGQCNNLEHPLWGAAQMALLRLLPPRYENGFNTPVGWQKGRLYNGYPLPNPRKVSQLLVSTSEVTPNSHLSAMVMQWGHYNDGAFCNRTCENLDPCFNIQLEPDDPKLKHGPAGRLPCLEFERNGAVCGSGETSVIFQRVTYRDQMNILTSFLDGSAIYGNLEVQSLELRDLYSDHGLLRFDIVSEAQKPYLPFEKDSDMDCRRNFSEENPIRCFLAGDFRANEQLGLMSMHTVFLREHNRIAGKLLELNTNWDGETIFQETRKILGAVIQKITYDDWLPRFLGKTAFNELIGEYKGYDPNVNPSISNEFTIALRFAHTLINPMLFRFDKDFKPIKEGHIPLHKAFFAPERLLSEGGVDPLLRGLFAAPLKLTLQHQLVNSELTEKLFSRYHAVALDLPAFNIQRARDHGLPAYMEYRKYCNLSAFNTWEEMATEIRNASVLQTLKDLYGHPANIDFWVGGILERPLSDSLMGPTFACIIADQFKRLRDGDRLWYENEGVFTKLQVQQIKKSSLAKILCQNGDSIDRIQRNVFDYYGNSTSFYETCESLPTINLNMWSQCCDSSCSASASPEATRKRRSVKSNDGSSCEDDTTGMKYPEGSNWETDECTECRCMDSKIWCHIKKDCLKTEDDI